MMPEEKNYNQLAGKKVQRIEAISDGVFAIALTLLVLDLKVPHSAGIKSEADLMNAFCSLTPQLLSYFLSFMTLGIFWTGQTVQFNYIEKSDRHLNWLSLFFLLFVSIIPFSTAFLSEHIEFRFALLIYWFNILSMGIVLYIHWNYAVKHGYVNLPEAERKTVAYLVNKRIIVAQSLYAASMLFCFISTYISIALIVLIQLNYALALFHRQQKN
jgi:uncharacterized membrane protein